MIATVIRMAIMLGAGISIAITSRILADHWLYDNKVINLSSLWTGVTVVLTMVFILALIISGLGHDPIYWRLISELIIVIISVIAGVLRYREIQGSNQKIKKEHSKQSPEEENLERFRYTTDELLTSQPQEPEQPPLAPEEDDPHRHSQ